MTHDMSQKSADRADIVVGVDGSDESFHALRWALAEAAVEKRNVKIVFGWTRSWDHNTEPEDDESWEQWQHSIVGRLRTWVDEACSGMDIDIDPATLTLTSVRASGTAALLQVGDSAHQIVVGRRSITPVLRWILGSSSMSLAQSAHVPVTIVRVEDKHRVEDDIATALLPDLFTNAGVSPDGGDTRPVVAGVDGSPASVQALQFAAKVAQSHRVPLHVIMCWRMRDYAGLPDIETMDQGQKRAEEIVASAVAQAELDSDIDVYTHVFSIAAAKGLACASRYASRLVIGAGGAAGADAYMLGSVSRQVVDMAECPLTVVH